VGDEEDLGALSNRLCRERARLEEAAMAYGPVEYMIVGFPGNQFNGEIAPALSQLIKSDTIRVLDLVFVAKDADGNHVVVEYDEHEGLFAFSELDGEVGGLISHDDIQYAADALEPDSSAALLVWEDTWAKPLVDAMRDSGGVLIESARIPHDLIEPALAALRGEG
jgi:hypothetical protein